MVVCQFFLENRCKFGDKCRNEHAHGGSQRSLFGEANQSWQQPAGGHRVNFRDTFGTSGQGGGNQYKWTSNQQSGQRSDGSAGQQTTTMDLVNSLPKEMESWEKTHMWPFSCFSVDKDLPSLQDFYDICPEELRFEAYQAIQSGNVQPYSQRVQTLQSEFESRRRQLQNMTMDLKSKLMVVIDEARKKKQTQSASANSTVFGFSQPAQHQSQASGSADHFGKSTGTLPGSSSSVLFGKATGATPGSNSGLFGKSTPGSSFGGAPVSELHSSSPFASSGTSLFGKPAGTGSVFGNQPQGQNIQTQNRFAIFNQSNTSEIFGQSTTPAQQSNNLFGQSTAHTQQPNSLFGQSTAQTQQTNNLFGQSSAQTQQPNNLFGQSTTQTQQPNTLFGKSTTQTPQPNSLTNQSVNIFSSSPSVSQPQGLFGQSAAHSFFPAAPETQPSMFGASASHGQPTATLFGKPVLDKAPTAQSLFGGHQSSGQNPSSVLSGNSPASSVGQGHYTPLEDLSAHEKEAFNAAAFELGRIPIRPPPIQMIN